jgi:FkbM family methyltransferase
MFRERLESKYTLDGFAEIEPGDVVIDCGAHVGGFSLAASDRARRVFAIEPDPRLQRTLSLTLDDLSAVSIYEIALSDDEGSIEFRLSDNPSENSMIDIDSGIEADRVTVTTTTLDSFLRTTNQDDIDFLKIDAEGAEPEVLRGLGDRRPRIIAVDTGPERRGERTTSSVLEILETAGYETRVQNDIVFGRYTD